MAVTLASGHLSDDELLDAFHSCRLQNDEFRHGDHLRLAWIHLHCAPFKQAVEPCVPESRRLHCIMECRSCTTRQ